MKRGAESSRCTFALHTLQRLSGSSVMRCSTSKVWPLVQPYSYVGIAFLLLRSSEGGGTPRIILPDDRDGNLGRNISQGVWTVKRRPQAPRSARQRSSLGGSPRSKVRAGRVARASPCSTGSTKRR